MRKGPDYVCDHCKAVLSDRGTGEDHLSLAIAPESGLAGMIETLMGYRIKKRLRARRYHWCNLDCMVAYLHALLYGDVQISTLVN